MASAKQKAAARKNIKKAQAALRRKRGGGRKRKSPKTKRATSSPARRRRSAIAPRRRRRTSTKRSFKRGAKGLLASINAKKAVKAGIVVSGLLESAANVSKFSGDSPSTRAQQVIAPTLDAIGAAKLFDEAVKNLAPGLTGDLWNWRPAGGKMPVVTVRRVVNALPSTGGWALAVKRYQDIRSVESASLHTNVFPRMSAMTGVKIRNAKAIGGSFIAAVEGGATDAKSIGLSVLASPGVAVGVGAAGSKLIASVRPI